MNRQDNITFETWLVDYISALALRGQSDYDIDEAQLLYNRNLTPQEAAREEAFCFA